MHEGKGDEPIAVTLDLDQFVADIRTATAARISGLQSEVQQLRTLVLSQEKQIALLVRLVDSHQRWIETKDMPVN